MIRLSCAGAVAISLALAGGLAAGQQPAATPKPQATPTPKPQVTMGISAAGQQTRPAHVAGARRTAVKPAPTPTPVPTPEPTPLPTPVPTPPPPPPQVTYRDGMLTVEALNCSLNTLLTAIRNKTGIEFEGIERANEPVAVMIGPAPEGEVLAGILAGSHYDFLVVGRPDTPGVVERVILSPRGTPSAMTVRAPQPVKPQADPDDENPDEQGAEDPQDTAAQPPQVGQQQVQPQPNIPKTAEQLADEANQRLKQQQGPAPATNQVPRKPPQ